MCSQACKPVILADPKWLPLTGGGVDGSWEEITGPYSTITVVLLCSVDWAKKSFEESYPGIRNILNLKLYFHEPYLLPEFEKEHHMFSQDSIYFLPIDKSWTRLSNFTLTFHFHALEKEMATQSSIIA